MQYKLWKTAISSGLVICVSTVELTAADDSALNGPETLFAQRDGGGGQKGGGGGGQRGGGAGGQRAAAVQQGVATQAQDALRGLDSAADLLLAETEACTHLQSPHLEIQEVAVDTSPPRTDHLR